MDDTAGKPSKALPIAVSGAIAVAVFGILLVVNGTGGPKGGGGDKTPGVAPTSDKPADKPADKPTVADKPADKPADTPTAGNDKPADKPADPPPTPPPAPKNVTLSVSVKPADAKVTVDGKPVTGGKIELPASDTPVKVAASAPGYVSDEKEANVAHDGMIAIELKKEVAQNPPPKEPPPTPNNTPPTNNNNNTNNNNTNTTKPHPPKKPPKKIEL